MTVRAGDWFRVVARAIGGFKVGNDGMTRRERDARAARYLATAGYRPPMTPERREHLRRLAAKSPGYVWRRPEPEAPRATASTR